MSTSAGKFYNWALRRTTSPYAPLWVGLLFFFELILFIPLDALLVFFCLQDRRKIFINILVAALASTLSGFCGYLLGHFLWDLIGPYVVPYLVSLSSFDRIAHHYQAYEHWAIFIGSLVPFPLKILSLSAGIFHLSLTTFITFLLVARTIRFALVGGAMYLWGETVKVFVERHFRRVLLIIGAKVAIGLAFFWSLAQ